MGRNPSVEAPPAPCGNTYGGGASGERPGTGVGTPGLVGVVDMVRVGTVEKGEAGVTIGEFTSAVGALVLPSLSKLSVVSTVPFLTRTSPFSASMLNTSTPYNFSPTVKMGFCAVLPGPGSVISRNTLGLSPMLLMPVSRILFGGAGGALVSGGGGGFKLKALRSMIDW